MKFSSTKSFSVVFLWTIFAFASGTSPWSTSHMHDNRTTIVQMFEWRFNDIADECERYLGPNNFGGVQVSPVTESALLWHPSFGPTVQRPWYERYQPVSYKIASRSGTEDEFNSMIKRCNDAKVRVYVDAVINHMTGSLGKAVGTGGSHYDSENFSYPDVGYNRSHFNSNKKCGTRSESIEDFTDPHQLRDCQLVGLHDLDQSQIFVRDAIVNMMNNILDRGVAGFRVDATKHMWPADCEHIFGRLHDLNTEYFQPNSRPLLYHEVSSTTDLYPFQYNHLGRLLEFTFRYYIHGLFKRQEPFRPDFTTLPRLQDSTDAVTFIDNHDEQRQPNAIFFSDRKLYVAATALQMALPYGIAGVMTSYDWTKDVDYVDGASWMGPPHDDKYNIIPVRQYQDNDRDCGHGWVCEHRWPEIQGMVQFRYLAESEPVENWWASDDGHRMSFSRGKSGFIVMNKSHQAMLKTSLFTGMKAGRYCDIISGKLEGDHCTGRELVVDESGHVDIEMDSEQFVIAFHKQSRL